MDRILRQRVISDYEAVDEQLSQSVQLFNLIESKDLFGEIYRENLAKRLLSDQPINEELEKACVQKFRADCGPSYTSKLEGMLNDVLVKAGAEFRTADFVSRVMKPDDNVSPASVSGVDFSLKILTKSNWPAFPELERQTEGPTFRPPLCLVRLTEAYEIFYAETSPRRRLTWVYKSSNVALTMDASDLKLGRRVELLLNTHQAAVLMLFNDKPEWTVDEIAEVTQMDNSSGYVRKLVASFVVQKNKILKATRFDNRKPDFNSSFLVNTEFTTPERRIKIAAPAIEDSSSSNKVETNRVFQIEASIVKILKTRQSMDYNRLFIAVNEHLANFKPNLSVSHYYLANAAVSEHSGDSSRTRVPQTRR